MEVLNILVRDGAKTVEQRFSRSPEMPSDPEAQSIVVAFPQSHWLQEKTPPIRCAGITCHLNHNGRRRAKRPHTLALA